VEYIFRTRQYSTSLIEPAKTKTYGGYFKTHPPKR
jgi:hypothetical protein